MDYYEAAPHVSPLEAELEALFKGLLSGFLQQNFSPLYIEINA